MNFTVFRLIMDEIIKLQELRAAELNRLVLIQHDQVEMLKSLLKVMLSKVSLVIVRSLGQGS